MILVLMNKLQCLDIYSIYPDQQLYNSGICEQIYKHHPFLQLVYSSGVPRNYVPRGGGSTNSVEDRENGDLEAVAP